MTVLNEHPQLTLNSGRGLHCEYKTGVAFLVGKAHLSHLVENVRLQGVERLPQ